MDLKSLKNIPKSFALAKLAILLSLVTAVIVVLSSLAWVFYVTTHFAETAYILTENGQMALAKGLNATEIDDYRRPEIKSHIYTFHRLFWNIEGDIGERDMNVALSLAGNSVKQLYLTLKANGHYGKMRNQNLVQHLHIKNIEIVDSTYPYTATLTGELTVSRTDQNLRSRDEFTATMVIQNVTRTDINPHGLLIESYDVKTNEIDTRSLFGG